MDHIMMQRQSSLALQVPKSVAVIGCGGVGSWIAYFLAMTGVNSLWLFDSKRVSESNLNRVPFPLSAVSKKKTTALAGLIAKVRPNCEVLSFSDFDPFVAKSLDLTKYVSWIVAATDTLASRQMIAKWALTNSISYIESAAEGEYGSATGEPALWKTPAEDQLGYASIPVWLGPCVLSAVTVVSYIVHNKHLGDKTIRLGWDTADGFNVTICK